MNRSLPKRKGGTHERKACGNMEEEKLEDRQQGELV
jgi:hypothetical protein